MTATYDCIATTTLGSGQTSVTFSSISGSFTDLVLVITAAGSGTGNFEVTFNSDTNTNYSRTQLSGNGTSASSARESNYSSYRTLNIPASTSSFAMAVFQIMNYSNTTTFKTLIDRGGIASDQTYAQVGLWRSTSAITSIKLTATTTLSSGSSFTLYGIKSEA